MKKVTAQPKKTSTPSNMTESEWKWHSTPPKTWLRVEPDGDFVTKEWTSEDGFRVTNVWNSIEGYRIVVRHADPECLRAFNNLLDAALDVPAIEGPLPGMSKN